MEEKKQLEMLKYFMLIYHIKQILKVIAWSFISFSCADPAASNWGENMRPHRFSAFADFRIADSVFKSHHGQKQ